MFESSERRELRGLGIAKCQAKVGKFCCVSAISSQGVALGGVQGITKGQGSARPRPGGMFHKS